MTFNQNSSLHRIGGTKIVYAKIVNQQTSQTLTQDILTLE